MLEMVVLPSHLNILDNRLYIGDYAFTDIANEFGTPTYVYDLERVVDKYRKLRDCFKQYSDREVFVYYAVKANFNPEILRALSKEGAGADVLSIYEAEYSLRFGFPRSRILFTGTSRRLRQR